MNEFSFRNENVLRLKLQYFKVRSYKWSPNAIFKMWVSIFKRTSPVSTAKEFIYLSQNDTSGNLEMQNRVVILFFSFKAISNNDCCRLGVLNSVFLCSVLLNSIR